MMSTKSLLPFLLLSGFAAAAAAAAPDSGKDAAATIKGELQVQIQSPTDGFVASDGQSVVDRRRTVPGLDVRPGHVFEP